MAVSSLFGDCVNEYYVALARENFERRASVLASIRDRAGAECYTASVREKLRKIFRLPERVAPKVRVTAKHIFSGFSIENLIFQSRPGWYVTANLYLPDPLPHSSEGGSSARNLPGVLFLCGHSQDGKGAKLYRTACIGLVLKGFAVLIPDPVEQGERRQYDGIGGTSLGLCGNHNLMGRQLLLTGEYFGTWRLWDALCALDLLESRPEVDVSRLYVTGNSGGGTLTALVGAVDPRPAGIAPGCYITSWKHNIENELPADIEQTPPHALEFGLEMGDLLLAYAPRSTLILAQRNDFFDPRGALETFHEVERINSFFGTETRLFVGPTGHGLYRENRETLYGFLTKLAFGKEDSAEGQFELPPVEMTFATENGTAGFPGSRLLRELVREKCGKLARARKSIPRARLRPLLAELLNTGGTFVPHYRVLRHISVAKDLVASRFALETEKGRIMSVLSRWSADGWYFIDPMPEKVMLYVPHLESRSELAANPPASPRSRRAGEAFGTSEAFYALDFRTIGEMTPTGTDQPAVRDFFAPYQFDYHYASLGLMAGRTVLAGKVHDILCAVELLAEHGAEITVEAHGLGCIPALFAAVLSDKIVKLKLTDCLESFESAAVSDVTTFPLSCIAPGILGLADIPELRDSIAEKLL